MNRSPVLAALALAALAAAPGLALKPRPDLAKDNEALPRISAPSTAATARINKALDRLDDSWRGFMKDCAASARGQEQSGYTERSVETVFTGPGFVGLVVRTGDFCGGAHPNTGGLALVYDLDSGRPVDWVKLLGPHFAATGSLETFTDGTKVGLVDSERLRALYLMHVQAQVEPDCLEVLNTDSYAFMVWPDAKTHSLKLEPFGFPQVTAACAETVALPVNELRAFQVDPRLLSAIAAGH